MGTEGASEGVLPNREQVLADLVRLQALSRELGDLCGEALEKKSVSAGEGGGLSTRAAESIRLVERLAGYASEEATLEEYRQATRRLESLIQQVDAAREPAELAAAQKSATDAVNAWAAAVERVLEGVLSRARP